MLKFFTAILTTFCFLYGMDTEEYPYALNSEQHGFSGWNPQDFDDETISWLLGGEQQKSANETSLLVQDQLPEGVSSSTSAVQSTSSMAQNNELIPLKNERKRRVYQCWKAEEHEQLKKILEEQKREDPTKIDWEKVAQHFPDKDAIACSHRYYHKLHQKNPNEATRKKSKKSRKK